MNFANQISGTAFTINKGSGTRGMNIENYVKAMTPSNNIAYTPYTLPDQILQTGVDENDTYYNSVKALNDFGVAMRAKNIDVLNPDADNPDSVVAAETFELLRRNVQQQGNGLRAGHDLAKFFTQQRLKKGNIATQPLIDEQGFSDATSTADLSKLRSIQPITSEVKSIVDAANLVSKRKITTAVELDAANIEINKKRTALAGMVDQLAEAYNVPKEIVQEVVSRGVNSISDAIGNDLSDKKFGLDERETAAREKVASSQAFNNRQAGKASARKGKAQDQAADDLIKRMIALNRGRGYDDRFASKKTTFLRDLVVSKGEESGTGKDSGADDKVVSGVFHQEGRAYAVVIPRNKLGSEFDLAQDKMDYDARLTSTDRRHKDIDILPLDTDFIRTLYNNNKMQDEFEDFMSRARETGALNNEGLLIFKKKGGIKIN